MSGYDPMKLEDFNFDLPEQLIASYPLERRDQSRLLHYSCDTDSLEHKKFIDILSILKPGDLIVRNNSRVLAARFVVDTDTGSKLEILLLDPITKSSYKALAGNAKRIKAGRRYFLDNNQEIFIERQGDDVLVDFGTEEKFNLAIDACGMMPIPPYMKRDAEEFDKQRYQTVYAREAGSVAAPTAGLHFTHEIDQGLVAAGIEIAELTLHVGLGTFAPIKVDNVSEHKMHLEHYSISQNTWSKILQAKKQGRRIIAVGSTSTRVLESVARTGELTGATDIFISPGFEFKIIDGLITNFHLPKSSLIVLISALIGLEKVQELYQIAIQEKYRFYSYGDVCLLL